MAIIGYVRSTILNTDLTLQVAALRAWGCSDVRVDKRHGEALRALLVTLQPGDIVMVMRIDCLAPTISELQQIVRWIGSKGAVLKTTEQPIDTSTAVGKCFLDVLGAFVEFEANVRRERLAPLMEQARTVDVTAVHRLRAQGLGGTAIARQLGISRMSVYRALAELPDADGSLPR